MLCVSLFYFALLYIIKIEKSIKFAKKVDKLKNYDIMLVAN